jgi:hypothetical protein
MTLGGQTSTCDNKSDDAATIPAACLRSEANLIQTLVEINLR